MKPLIIIPARGGSKGIPGKNVKSLNGKPLIQYTIEAALEIFPKELICVSTDDDKIKTVAESLGLVVPFLRPDYLASDSAGTHEVVIHAVDFYEKSGFQIDVVILLQPTSPMRKAEHIRRALSQFDEECEMVVSVKETRSNPYYVLREENLMGWLIKSKEGNFTRRQDCPKVYEYNGAIYIMNKISLIDKTINGFTRIRKYVMSERDSLDIDTELDFAFCDWLLKGLYL
jgi:CMP-N,N'-diacetyllegionaminic acid synthase